MDRGLFPLRDILYKHYVDTIRGDQIRAGDDLDFTLKVATGKFEEMPFPEADLDSARASVARYSGLDCGLIAAAPGQSLRLDLIKGLLLRVGDPDAEFFEQLREGVPLGVDETMPRTPDVFEEKVKWKLGEVEGPGEAFKDNYRSLKGHEKEVRDLFHKEAREGWMLELSNDEAKATFKDKLFIAAIAVVEEPGKIRVVHDGSNTVHVNHRIRPRGQTRSPGVGEIRRILREQAATGAKLFGIAGDVSKAHRRIKVRMADWGYQACRLDPDKVWVNCVGTYGMGSAAYWWSRASGGAMVRLPHYLLGPELLLELLLYVDDFLLIARTRSQVRAAGFVIFVMCLLGIPFSWRKFRGGTDLSWIGYWTDLRAFRLGVSQARADWVVGWIDDRLREGKVTADDLAAVLGRLSFAMGPLEHARPFLAPLYAWANALTARGPVPIPWSVRFLLHFVREQFTGDSRAVHVQPIVQDLGPAFRADAKAEGQTVVIGGWGCAGGRPPSHARWFSIDLSRRTAPWAFARGAALPLHCST